LDTTTKRPSMLTEVREVLAPAGFGVGVVAALLDQRLVLIFEMLPWEVLATHR
jgi:demethoxyubiquinone hydroxylase (CLK1/Coq7/Cat5 family)